MTLPAALADKASEHADLGLGKQAILGTALIRSDLIRVGARLHVPLHALDIAEWRSSEMSRATENPVSDGIPKASAALLLCAVMAVDWSMYTNLIRSQGASIAGLSLVTREKKDRKTIS